MLMPSIFGETLFDDLFDDFTTRPANRPARYAAADPSVMRTDIKEQKDGYELEIDLPGYKKEDIAAELKDGYLTITASSKKEAEEKDEKGQLLQIIKWSTYPLKDGDEVTIDQEGEHKKQSGENRRILEKQKSIFFLFGITVLDFIFYLCFWN